MPIRIYALAKELKLDSKDLVEICNKAGITGKGSALASLEDAEVDKLKTYLAGGEKKNAPAPVPVPPKASPLSARASGPLSSRSPAPATPASPAAPAAPTVPEVYTRDDYMTPVAKGKIKVIGASSAEAKKKDSGSDDPKPKKKREPVIRLAEMPDAPQPAPKAVSSEPAAQKPEIRLPKDAIAGAKKGTAAPLEQIAAKAAEKPAKSPLGGKGGLSRKPAAAANEGDAPLSAARGRRGKGAKVVEEGEGTGRGLSGLASARADRQKARKSQPAQRSRSFGRDDDTYRSRRRRTLTRKGNNTAAPRKGKASLELPCTVRTFSEAAGVPSAKVQRALMGLGMMATINAQIENEYIDLLIAELGVDVEIKAKETLEESIITKIREQENDPDRVQPRPPIVTFLGHVDHGKTSLLDRVLGIDVVSGEAGGITQHIRAYKVDNHGRPVSFVDTPGHEAFTEMRARGANVTDIAVLVVAADDGVMPQTEEAIAHAKAAGVPIVVALNKIDLPGVDVNRIMQELATRDLLPSEWGGDVEVVKTSAIAGTGIDELLETLLAIAELNEYVADPERDALGVCIEAQQEGGRGVVAKVIVRNGTLRVGDIVVCGPSHGRVKAMYDTLNPTVSVEEAGPSTPVNITGLDVAPGAGDAFYVLDDITEARQIAETRATSSHRSGLSGQGSTKISFERFQELLADGRLGQTEEAVVLNVIIRADVQGSLEAINKELEKLDHPEVQIKILQQSVGGITVGDVHLADASNAVILGFNVIPDEAARSLADDRRIEIRRYDIIYKMTEDLKAMLEGKLKPEERVIDLGRALVKQVFAVSKAGTIAGCYVIQGSIERGCRIRINRDGRTIGDYPLDSLRRVKEDVKEVARGLECGMKLSGFNDIKQDDVLEAYKIEEFARTL
ncbi:MAG: translation initiation factor IF-2 [Planctomycetaceae bacterium]|nr:translation initiation factor IF-2 [Planctomycetales bacterium]MCB9875157.1 translation initiation factor IF-2 [Planctomycetaceae bacterium]MCB9940254.1 translation initiation factor IF-2 [Planctomycetaceae bacterium]